MTSLTKRKPFGFWGNPDPGEVCSTGGVLKGSYASELEFSDPIFGEPTNEASRDYRIQEPASGEGDNPMEYKKVGMGPKKKIVLVAHDNKKNDLLEWAKFNRDLLADHTLYATGTTDTLLENELGLKLTKLQSGQLGGDQQVGAKIAEGIIEFLTFFWDPLEPQPHDPDVKALLRIAVVWNIPAACNRASADFIISSSIMTEEYHRLIPDYEAYRQRFERREKGA